MKFIGRIKKRSKNFENELQHTEFGKSIIKKQFRFSDWLAQKVITSVAFFSIAFVVLIFLFVFRETLPIFYSEKKQTKSTEAFSDASGNNTDDLKPENYSSEEYTSADLKPESYSPDEDIVQEGELKPESYFPDATTELKPETYSADENSGSISEELKPERYGSEESEPIEDEYNPYSETISADAKHPLKTLLTKDWLPVSDNPRYGLLPLLIGTFKVTIIAILFAAPLAILAALYTAMFAPKRIKEYIKPMIELMAGLPSVVIGFFALMILASVLQILFGYSGRLNALVGGIAMGLAAIPIIFTLTEDALSAVPKTYIEASLGLGASMRQTAFSVVLPAAIPGIFASILLGIGRVFGETMIALMATGNAALMSMNPFESVRTLSATIGAEMAEVVFGDTHYSILFLIGSILFIFSFALNAIAEFYLKNKLIRRIQGK
jgi:phosphate transport system permease protein